MSLDPTPTYDYHPVFAFLRYFFAIARRKQRNEAPTRISDYLVAASECEDQTDAHFELLEDEERHGNADCAFPRLGGGGELQQGTPEVRRLHGHRPGDQADLLHRGRARGSMAAGACAIATRSGAREDERGARYQLRPNMVKGGIPFDILGYGEGKGGMHRARKIAN